MEFKRDLLQKRPVPGKGCHCLMTKKENKAKQTVRDRIISAAQLEEDRAQADDVMLRRRMSLKWESKLS